MTLDWLAGLDDAALQAAGSAGLLRRARAAVAGPVDTDAAGASVQVGGFRVRLDRRGLAAARCTCPAGGLCLHILAAVLALRQAAAPGPAADAGGELAALTAAEIADFAGSDLDPALRIAAATPPPEPGSGSLRIQPAGLSHPVTFPAGAGLRGAVWKGPAARRRLAVTAAALALRAARGLPLPAAGAAPCRNAADPHLPAAVAAAVEEALPLVLAGCGALAADRLLDLALSARLDAAPRLAAALRALVQLALDLEAGRHGADPPAFLIAAARCHALAHALRSRPDDAGLRGRLHRDYRPAPQLDLVMLGARLWRGAEGARGLRLVGYDRAGGRWILAGAARAGGQDPLFDPRALWGAPLLGAAPGPGLMGRTLHLDAPRLADDRLAPDSLARVAPTPATTCPNRPTGTTLPPGCARGWACPWAARRGFARRCCGPPPSAGPRAMRCRWPTAKGGSCGWIWKGWQIRRWPGWPGCPPAPCWRSRRARPPAGCA